MPADSGVGVTHHRNQVKWIVYVSLLLLRFVGVFQRGYIHPDEFFQGGQELFFGIDGRDADLDFVDDKIDEYLVQHVPWEFRPNHAVRSIVPPSFMTLLPLRLYVSLRDNYWMGMRTNYYLSTVDGEVKDVTSFRKSSRDSYWKWTAPDGMNLSGKEILVVPRLFMAVLSVVFLDGSLWILTNLRRRRWDEGKPISCSCGPPIEVICIASSWPCLAFGVRPFTNSLEAMVLAFLLVIVAMRETQNNDSNSPCKKGKGMSGTRKLAYGSIPSLILIGATCSVGVFVRFTFIFFAFPVVILHLLKRWSRWDGLGCKLIYIIHDGIWLTLSFLLVSYAFIDVDTQYYSRGVDTTCAEFGSMLNYITPLNAFLYNSNRSNLAHHGLHPRLTHIAVNLPLLFGPLALVCYSSTIRRICFGDVTTTSDDSCPDAKATCQWAIAFGLFLLSCAPHQEPRFLLPLIVPLVYLYGRTVNRSRALLTLWIVFNLACYIFFAWLHQGGLLQSLLQFERLISIRNGSAPSYQPLRVFIYYKTYMPPSFFTRRRRRMEEACKVEFATKTCVHDTGQGKDVLLDLKGADSAVLLALLRKWLSCPNRESNVSEKNVDVLYLISPPAALLPIVERLDEAMMFDNYSILTTWDYRGHVSTEDWPCFEGSAIDFIGQLKLGIYSVSCNQ